MYLSLQRVLLLGLLGAALYIMVHLAQCQFIQSAYGARSVVWCAVLSIKYRLQLV